MAWEGVSFVVAWIGYATEGSGSFSFWVTRATIRVLAFQLRKRAALKAHFPLRPLWRRNSSSTLSVGSAARSDIPRHSASENSESLGPVTPGAPLCARGLGVQSAGRRQHVRVDPEFSKHSEESMRNYCSFRICLACSRTGTSIGIHAIG